MDISENELLARAVENQTRLQAAARARDDIVRDLIANCDLAFGLYPDESRRGFNYTVIKGAEHLGNAKAARWNVIPFDDAEQLDAACGLYGDYEWMPPDAGVRGPA